MDYRQYDLTDLELIKDAPRRWLQSEWAQIGICEGAIRDGRAAVIRVQMHLMVRAAKKAYLRESMYCPWGDEQERKPFKPFVTAADDVQPTTAKEVVLAVLSTAPNALGMRKRDILVAAAKLANYTEATLSQALQSMEKDGAIKRIDYGCYAMLPKAGRHPVVVAARA